MRLLFDHQIFTHQIYGGISRYYYELISNLIKKNQIEISLFMGYFINKFGLENYKQSYKEYFGKKHMNFYKSKFFYLYMNNFLFKRFVKKNNYDIYHQTYYQYINVDFKGERIITVYDMTHELYPNMFGVLDRGPDWKRYSINKADGIICISRSTKNDLLNFFNISPKKVEVIYLGTSSVKEFEKKKVVDTPYILFVGDRVGYKNFYLLIKCFATNNYLKENFKLVCFGRYDFTKEERKNFKEYGIESNVKYLTGSDKLLANLYYNAMVFVYPSKCEGFGLPPLEAMNYGCPVVASNSSSIPEVIGDAGLYFDPENAEELGEKLNEVVSNDVLRNDLIKKGFKQKDKFSWKKCADETLKFYERILNS